MVPKITKKLDSKNPDHLMAVIEEFRDEIRVVNEINQKVDKLSLDLKEFKQETEVNFKAIHHYLFHAPEI
ncbi:MAG: hypothetical protein AAB589_02295 [Patescibacteria group bacterium]